MKPGRIKHELLKWLSTGDGNEQGRGTRDRSHSSLKIASSVQLLLCHWKYAIILYVYKINLGFPGGSMTMNPPANAGDTRLIPGQEDSLQ